MQDAGLELVGDRSAVDLPVLTPEVAPRLVGREQHPVLPDTTALDLGHQPARPEADRPGGVAVHLVALLDPVQELRHQLDVTADAAAEVDQVDLDPLAVLLHSGMKLLMSELPPGLVW